MDLDAKVCYCFHVTRRKLVNYTRICRPRVASQLLSEITSPCRLENSDREQCSRNPGGY